jgi:hypothetical protein
MAAIPGPLLGEVFQVVVETFDRGELSRALRFRMDVELDNIIGRQAFPNVVEAVFQWARRADREAELVLSLAQVKPRNAALQQLYQRCGMAVPVTVTSGPAASRTRTAPRHIGDPGLQALVRERLPAVELLKWTDRLAQIEARVCVVTINGKGTGTGFLIGRQAVLTSYHVIKKVIEKAAPDAKIQCFFDYKILDTGARTGTVLNVDEDNWLVDASPPTAGEEADEPDRTVPTMEELDYAVLRLAEPVSAERGWERVTSANPTLEPRMALLIPQHPDGQPLMLAVDTDAIDRDSHFWLNGNGTRIRYASNTARGSSGSPCFDMNWHLIALHHYGDAGYGRRLGYNQGVPIWLIGRRLRDPSRDQKILDAMREVRA